MTAIEIALLVQAASLLVLAVTTALSFMTLRRWLVDLEAEIRAMRTGVRHLRGGR